MTPLKSKISFNFDNLKWEGISVDQVKLWENAYPDVDVIDILTKKMPIWLLANPEKAKKKKWARFIINWLSRQQGRYDDLRRGRR